MLFLPISDENPTLRTPVVTILLLVTIGAVWLFVQGAGFDAFALAASVCNLGLVPGELTGQAPVGLAVPLGEGAACVVDRDPINLFTPLTSMFLHGGWGHVLLNGLFLWVFGNNVEDSLGRGRFLVFYVLCGLAAAALQVAVTPSSPVPMVGASGAIAGVLGAYLVLYPRVRVNVLILVFIVPFPAWAVLIQWIVGQLLVGLPQLTKMRPDVSSGVAVFAHIGGFMMGLLTVKLFENRRFVREREGSRHRLHAPRW